MARFTQSQAFRPSNTDDGSAARYSATAKAFGDFSNTMLNKYAENTVRDAKKDAQNVDLKNPVLVDNNTIYGDAFDKEAKQLYLTSLENDSVARLGELAAENANDPKAFNELVAARRKASVDQLPQQMKGSATVLYDSVAAKYSKQISQNFATNHNKAAVLLMEENMGMKINQAVYFFGEGKDAEGLQIYTMAEQQIMGSTLTEDKKVELLLNFRHKVNETMDYQDVRYFTDKGEYKKAVDYIDRVRKGKVKPIFDTGETGDFRADRLQVALNKDIATSESILDATFNGYERQKKWREIDEDKAGDEGRALMVGEGVTKEWVEDNVGRLSDSDFNFFSSVVKNGGHSNDTTNALDKIAYLDLEERSRTNENIKKDADRAWQEGRISATQRSFLLKEHDSWVFGRGNEVLNNMMKMSGTDKSLPNANRITKGLDDWELFKRTNPDATVQQAQERIDQIVDSITFYDADTLKIGRPKPWSLVRTKNGKMDKLKTSQATDDYFYKKYGIVNGKATPAQLDRLDSDREYQIQLERIEFYSTFEGLIPKQSSENN